MFNFFRDAEWKKLSKAKKEKLGLTFENDGEFYMEFIDFLKYFSVVDILHKSPAKMMRDQTSTNRYEVIWFNKIKILISKELFLKYTHTNLLI